MSNEELIEKMEAEKLRRDIDLLISEILCSYKPHEGPGAADYTPTSVELANKISETITVNPDTLAISLLRRGFHTKLVGAYFRWQMDINLN